MLTMPTHHHPRRPRVAHLPFYQHIGDQQHQLQHAQYHDDQNGGGAEEMSGGEGGDEDASQEVPDDPALRSHLANMMGAFGGFPHFMQQNQNMTPATSNPLQPDPEAFAQPAEPEEASSTKQARTKVSRACDECRRKKIRCDALDETGGAKCGPCVRTGSKCAFSRQPLKRGPSKGYIKELAERLNTLERQVHPPGHMQQQHQNEIQRVQREMAEGLRAHGWDGLDPRAGDKRPYAEMMQNDIQPAIAGSSRAPMPAVSYNAGSKAVYPATTPTTTAPGRHAAILESRRA